MKHATANQRKSMPARPLLILVLLAFALGRDSGPARATEGSRPRFTAPTNQQELAARIDELRRQYEPFLRSLPPPLRKPQRAAMPGELEIRVRGEEVAKSRRHPLCPRVAWRRIR